MACVTPAARMSVLFLVLAILHAQLISGESVSVSNLSLACVKSCRSCTIAILSTADPITDVIQNMIVC